MDPEIITSVLQDRKIAYFITDRDLTVVARQGTSDPFCEGQTLCLGASLLALVPELIGSEETLTAILAGELPRFELDWVNRLVDGGQIRYLAMVTLPRRDEDGEICGLLHLIQDVTAFGAIDQQLSQQRNELHLLQAQLTRQNQVLAAANAELQRLDDLKSQFIMTTAHELRTPLTTIRGYLEMLLDGDFGPVPEAQRTSLSLVGNSAARLQSIAEALIDATRIDTGHVEILLQPEDLLEIVAKVAAEFKPQIQQKQQVLAIEAPTQLPPALCDRRRMAQILGNLLGNATRYTLEGGRITVQVRALADQDAVELVVEDTGIGIAPEDQLRLFERFFRARNAKKMTSKGIGLGLYITRELVALQGGEIWVESAPGEGSAFYVRIPVAVS